MERHLLSRWTVFCLVFGYTELGDGNGLSFLHRFHVPHPRNIDSSPLLQQYSDSRRLDWKFVESYVHYNLDVPEMNASSASRWTLSLCDDATVPLAITVKADHDCELLLKRSSTSRHVFLAKRPRHWGTRLRLWRRGERAQMERSFCSISAQGTIWLCYL